jgi:tetratricopeptide (TPR) repeat protein
MVYSPPRAEGGIAAEDPAATSAIRRYEERLAKDPGSMAFAPLADAYRKAGRTSAAIRLCREGLERFPEYATARLILAKALLDEGNADAAMAEVRAILQQAPADASAHRLAGELHRRAGRLAEAIPHLRQAVALDPSDRESRVMLEVLEADGKAPGSSTLARLLADNTFATMSFATVCLEQGLVDEAAQIFLRLLRKNPDDAQARTKLDEALRARTQKRKGP